MLFYYGVEVTWLDGSKATFKYETEEQARNKVREMDKERTDNKNAYYSGRCLNWTYIFSLGRRIG